MRAHMLQKNREDYNTIDCRGAQETRVHVKAQLSNCQESTFSKQSATEILKKTYHKIIDFRSLLATFWTPGPLLGGIWQPKGNRANSGHHFYSTFDGFGEPLGIPLDPFWKNNCKKLHLGCLFLRFWKRSSKNTEICVISDPLQPSRLSSRAGESSILTIYP